MESEMDNAMGRCPFFAVLDTQDGDVLFHANPGINEQGGAGIKAAEFLINLGIDHIITGSVGPNARPLLKRNNISIINRFGGKIGEIISELNETNSPMSNLPSTVKVNPETNTPPIGASNTLKEDDNGNKHSKGQRGPRGYCYCRGCGRITANDGGGPCYSLKCPNCGLIMERKWEF